MRLVVLAIAVVTACGGQQIPQHNGYKANAKPWKKFKTLKWDDKGEAKADGDLAYGQYRRSAWYAVDLPVPGEIDFRIEVTPPGEAVNDAFDLGAEVFDSGYRMLVRKDAEEGDAAGDLNKQLAIKDQPPGRYYIHLYLQGRLDTCDYVLHALMKGSAPAQVKSDFPAQVAFLPALAMVPIQDEAPKNYKPTPTAVVTHVVKKGHVDPVKPPPPPPVAGVTARILQVNVVSGGTQIVIGRGTESGANDKMHGKINGTSISFTIAGCSPRTCTAVVAATPDQIKASAGDVSMSN